MKVIIIGGGIIGAALARYLGKAGADVTVMEVGAGATVASFGWINASFHLNEDHFRLRVAGLAAWRKLDVPITWSGTLCWDAHGDALEAQCQVLARLGYQVDIVDSDGFAALEPHVAAPSQALRFASEGVAEPQETAQTLLRGTKRIRGVPVEGLHTTSGRITGVVTTQGVLPADRVIVAAGNGSPALLHSVDVALPMLDRPAVMMRTAPVPSRLSHILVTPDGEVRQDSAGHIWSPTAAQHQSDDSDRVEARPDVLADKALARLQALLPDTELRWDEVMLAHRPMPKDQLPVFGPAGPEGLFTAMMHSGVTLAAVTAELLGPQVLDQPLSNAQAALAAPYGIDRFQSAMS